MYAHDLPPSHHKKRCRRRWLRGLTLSPPALSYVRTGALKYQVQHFLPKMLHGKIYDQLSLEERTMIHTQLELGFKPAAIARELNRSASTLSRELRRNGWTRPPTCRGPGRHPVAGGLPCRRSPDAGPGLHGHTARGAPLATTFLRKVAKSCRSPGERCKPRLSMPDSTSKACFQ